MAVPERGTRHRFKSWEIPFSRTILFEPLAEQIEP
jgi:hypothetical protein